MQSVSHLAKRAIKFEPVERIRVVEAMLGNGSKSKTGYLWNQNDMSLGHEKLAANSGSIEDVDWV